MRLTTKLKTCLVLLLILSITSVSLASPGKYVQLEKDQKIPWKGWCFDGEAMARIVAEKELAEKKCELKTLERLEQQSARYDLQIGQLQASMEYEVQTRDVAIQSLQEENLKLEQALIHETKFGWIAPASFGVLVGALTFFLVSL